MLAWLGYLARVVLVVAIGLGFAVAASVGALLLGLLVWDRARRARLAARWRGKLLRRSMATLGATFIKLGQVLSTRPDLLPAETIDELKQLQDRLPPFRFAKVVRAIEADVGPITEHFAEIDPVPVAAASIAQVHRGRLHDGTEVAIKVVRPGVDRVIDQDGRLLLALARLAELSAKWRLSQPVAHCRELIAGIRQQTDLRREAGNYLRFAKNFAATVGVRFPRTYPAHSGDRVLTMTFLRGKKIDALPHGDHRALARRTRTTFFKMCFEDGFVHADLHPGNMMVLDGGELAVFDVGLSKELGGALTVQLVDFVRCVAMGTSRDFVAHLQRFHSYMGDVDWAEVERDADRLVASFRDQKVAELEMGAFIREVFAIARKHRIHPLPEMTLVLVGVVTAEGISKMLAPEVNTFHELAGYLVPICARHGLVAAG